ncbi:MULTISPECIES: peptide-methionine (S)-S-oxide reductase MsrA [Rothia]|uniref:Peptide methionine sulfoxide reductase MsrA n=1 Tax=Rothia nasimurium TaxID=85336 RepID=A0A1Y1RR09_9MICC|nr:MULTISPECIES: peptide-methionine (S)-S-oxide reductase MsrA [Rothia]ORC22159.1 peptide-methionine (S)-S-oxide reductase [Rothia nasimurium]
MQSFVFGGGCFWCIDAVYRQFDGITASVSGYTGGHTENPTYREVCSGLTGHVEVVKVEFDEAVIPAETVLDIFFTSHDPTSWDRQGADVGSQYRSALYYSDEQQKQLFESAITRAQKLWERPIVTVVEPLGAFYEAESYHQNYYALNPYQGYCMAVINPKLSKARQRYAKFLKA